MTTQTVTPKTFAELLRAEIRAERTAAQESSQEKPEGKVIKVPEERTEVLARQEELPVKTEMGAGMLGGLDSIDHKLPFPFVSVAVGGIGGLLFGEVVDLFAAPKDAAGKTNFINVAVKGAAVLGVASMGRRYLGNTGAMAFGTVLVAQVAADMLPIADWAAKIKGWFPSTAPAALRQMAQARQPHPITSSTNDKISNWFH